MISLRPLAAFPKFDHSSSLPLLSYLLVNNHLHKMPASRQTLSWRGCASLALALLVFATPFAASAHHNGGALEARGDMGLEEEAMLHPREVAILKSALERRAKCKPYLEVMLDPLVQHPISPIPC